MKKLSKVCFLDANLRDIKLVNKMRFISIVFLVATTLASLNVLAGESFNALWNDDENEGLTGFWLYEGAGGCPDLREKYGQKVIVVGGKIKEGVNLVNNLQYCFDVSKISENVVCKNGYIEVKKDESKKTYNGTYSLTLSNGKKYEGKILAQYCPEEKY